ncbi:tyrosine-type recombinase/integrase [Plectonema cf. radiosum LEGE 06105]|uniref:Tyrosine-type recombinase/integrase n=1 Tax=Plectonema cf. radiosum LEGE 06105 TaxID=945769 RepID=A0A8J7F3M8_9CYAN|nr:tyrosine-type recombinase/integrase [Plectonema radiosum]MBE9212660.1 tyrosine-type recombinase/integrase [Plectonema cf. radiosum LEGE 06105]
MTITLAALVTQFLDRSELTKSTVRSYESVLIPLLKNYGRWSVEIIDRDILVEYLNGLERIKFTTHHKHQAVITALFNFAVERGHLKSNPISKLKRRKPDFGKGEYDSDEEIRYLTTQELSLLYQAVKSDARLNALVHLLHSTGARIAEILALNLKDLDTEKRKFQVIGKRNKQRWCFYSQAADSCLNNYLKYYRHSNISALFTAQQPFTLDVSCLSYPTAYKSLVEAIKGIKELQGIRFHHLRHTFATERVGLMGIDELRALMGHSSIQMTLRYSKVTSKRAAICCTTSVSDDS